jgi:hypothetical protein
MRISLADSSTWNDKIPRLKPNIVSLKPGHHQGQHNHLPRHVGKVRSSFDQRIMSILR